MKSNALVKNISWTFAATIINSVIQIVQLGIVGHFVAVSDMGLLSVVIAIVNIGIIFQDVGFSSFLIYKQDITDNQRHILFTLNIVLGILLFFGALGSAGFIEDLINKPGFASLMMVGGLNFLALGLGSQAQAILIKSKMLDKLAIFDMLAKGTGLALVVGLLYSGFDIYSQLIGMISANLIMSLLCFYAANRISPIRFYAGRDTFALLREPLSFGGFHLGSVLIGEFRKQFDVFLAARFMPAHLLGLYTVGKELALRSMIIIRPVIQKVVMPIYAERQKDNKALSKAYLATLHGITVAYGLPAIVGIVFAEFFLTLIYGERYADAQQFFAIFLLIAYLRCLGLPTGILAQSVGKTSIEFSWNVISTIILGVSLVIAVFFSATYFAYTILGVQIALTILQQKLFLGRLMKLSVFKYTLTWLPGLIVLTFVYLFWVGV
ncbi:oligosaccharide flippase family protein [Larsenimonas suaedae]|uniref:Oligosaccharide flippase family protein n=1 Tax=Larsenimonas suaedae TaxID=1851019 RepID=A0ABU1GXU6_9GAMM|nr:oligosaccharide flippase family protein [Larsenimonas suaedae]MCM2971558.1 oligosaccharide flippase family protein [Larsenimonas suaedae]MDR5896814.1 oligosaccharide flippase family protein [Larsenimonas suaedae]